MGAPTWGPIPSGSSGRSREAGGVSRFADTLQEPRRGPRWPPPTSRPRTPIAPATARGLERRRACCVRAGQIATEDFADGGEGDPAERDRAQREPAELRDVVVGADARGDETDAVHGGEDGHAVGAVAVAGKADENGVARADADLLTQLASQGRLRQLVGFQEAAGEIPGPLVGRPGPAAQQQAPALDHDGGSGRNGVGIVGPAAARAAPASMTVLHDGAQSSAAREAEARCHECRRRSASRRRSAIERRARAAGASGATAT